MSARAQSGGSGKPMGKPAGVGIYFQVCTAACAAAARSGERAVCACVGLRGRRLLDPAPQLPERDGAARVQESGSDIVVNHLIRGGSAERSGKVQAGDVIVAIDDKDVRGKGVSEMRNFIVGPEGSKVRRLSVLALRRFSCNAAWLG